MRVDANVAKGMSPDEAIRKARLRFGNPAVTKERVDAEDAALGIESFFRDARYAVRGFMKTPGFTIVAVLTLALGIGANTAVFQLLDAVRLRSLPIQAPQELAEVRIVGGTKDLASSDGPFTQFTIPMWQEVRRNHDPFSGVFAWRRRSAGGQAERRKAGERLEVSGEFFNVLGVAPLQGRLIEPQDEAGARYRKRWRVIPSGSRRWAANRSRRRRPSGEVPTVQVLGVTPPAFSACGRRQVRSRLSYLHAAESTP